MPIITRDQKLHLANRCDRMPNGLIFVPYFVIKKYWEFTHDYKPTGDVRELIRSFYNEFEVREVL